MQYSTAIIAALLAASGAEAASLHRRVLKGPTVVNGTTSAEPVADLADLVTKLEKEGKIQWKNTQTGQMAEVAEAIIKAASKPSETGPDGPTGTGTGPLSTGTGSPSKKILPVRAAPVMPGASGTPDHLSIAGMEATLTCAKPKDETLAAGVSPDTLVQNANMACQDFAAAAATMTASAAGPTGTGSAAKAATAYHLWRPKPQPAQAQPQVQPGQQQQQQQMPAQRGAIVWYQGVGATPAKLTPEMCNQALQTLADPQKSKCTGQGHSASISMAVGGVAALGDKKTGGLNLGVNAMKADTEQQQGPAEPKQPKQPKAPKA